MAIQLELKRSLLSLPSTLYAFLFPYQLCPDSAQ